MWLEHQTDKRQSAVQDAQLKFEQVKCAALLNFFAEAGSHCYVRNLPFMLHCGPVCCRVNFWLRSLRVL
jgi:hypothetical protein